ncbi:MAG: entericidin EcnA/B family protein [Verrucomicrobiota bacterium]
MKKTPKLLIAAIALCYAVLASGCNTVRGLGEDVQNLGESMQEVGK